MSDPNRELLSRSAIRWSVAEPPFVRPAPSTSKLGWITTVAALPAAVGGMIVFGAGSAIIVALCVLTAVLADRVLSYLSPRGGVMGAPHAVMTGLLLALTLPPRVDWTIPVTGALIAVLVGKGLLGGHGNYLWSPVLVGRVGLQLLAPKGMWPESWPVLGGGRLLFGDPGNAASPPPFFSWIRCTLPEDADAWLLPRIDALLSSLRDGVVHAGPETMQGMRVDSIGELVFHVLPPWGDVVLGLVGGGIGETCCPLILLGGLYLIHRGTVRWQLPVCVLIGAALAAATFPVASGFSDNGRVTDWLWFPGLAFENLRPVGPVYVLYHLTAGELLFGAFFIASDMVATPMLARGQIIFGLAVGVLTICLRMFGIIPGACYWAILIMNPFVPLIDRLTRRRIFGL